MTVVYLLLLISDTQSLGGALPVRMEGKGQSKERTPIPMMVIVLMTISFIIIGTACIILPASRTDKPALATLASLSTHVAIQATDLTRQDDMIEYLVTQGPVVGSPIPASGDPTPYRTENGPTEGAPSNSTGSTDAWPTYHHVAGDFSLQFPIGFEVIEKSGLLGGFIGKRIEFNVVDESPYWVLCQTEGIGDCPVMENIQVVELGDTPGTRITGHIGAIGGNIPQDYVTYVIDDGRFYIFTLWAADFDVQLSSVGTVLPLSAKSVDEFDTLMQTFKLEEQS